MFQLKVLVLSNCNLNKLDKGIPTFLSHQYNLLAVDLSQNNLAGRFPDRLLQNNTRLKFVKLQSNSFMGQFQLPPYPNMNLSWMDVSDNHFGGQLPKNIGTILPRLWLLHLSRNAFQGPLPSSIANDESEKFTNESHNALFAYMLTCTK
ncbi:receptor-like protein 13 [Quercus suber]|uniref:Receptor-like protein 13 n=1 Tax=Quercus suber TaxID=58331 RepID=A0AAW0K7J3_QUESU